MKILVKISAILCLLAASCFAQISGIGNFGCSGATVTGTAITSATANNTVVFTSSNFAAWGYSVQLTQTTTVTGGAVSFQISTDGGTTYTNVPTAQVLNTSTFVPLTNPYTLVASTNQSFLVIMDGATNFQVKLTTAMTGSGTITPSVSAVCTAPFIFQDLRTIGGVAPTTAGKIDVKGADGDVFVRQTTGSNLHVQVDAGTALIGESPNTATATTTNAALGCGITSTASTNSTSCKGSSGNVYGMYVINETSTKYYLRIYNTASAPTCSSATGFIQSYSIPQNSGAGAGFTISFPVPLGFSTGIGYCITGGSSSTDNTNAAAGIFGTILYK